MGTLTALAVAMGLGGSSGCHQQIVQPDPERVALTVVNVNNPCTRVAFAVTGNNSVTATMPSSTCGESPFKIVSAGTMTWKQNPNRLLKIPVRILNKDEVSVPAYYVPRIVLRPIEKKVINPAGASPATMVPLNPDSTRADGTAVWLMTLPDSVFVELPGAFPPRSTTNSRTLEFRINSPTIAGVFEFDLVGERFEVADSVPAVAPDSTPVWFVDDSSWTSDGVLKRVLWVEFKPVSVGARKEAVDSVGGTVIGGDVWKPGDMGFYLIRVPGAITRDSLEALADILRRQPAVSSVMLVAGRGGEGWRRPNDGGEWAAGDWKLRPLESDRENWALEAVAGPLAWGCSTGDPQTTLAVLERSFTQDEYSGNLVSGTPQHGRMLGDTNAVAHGTIVANLLAAQGNDGRGMTGVLWRIGLRLHQLPALYSGRDVAKGISATARAGATIINLSLELDTVSDTAMARRNADGWRQVIKRALDSLASNPAGAPLLIVLAGNHDRDPVLAGPAGVALDYPKNVLVVGAARRPDSTGAHRMLGSGMGSVVDVYAPGDTVFFRSDSFPGTPRFAIGTSFAAPIVAGIAGLLKSFDPSMSARTIHDLILVGADSGRIGIIEHQGKYLANAYEALKAAARRPNAPLCGNRVWVQNAREIVVDRGTSIQTIYTAATQDTLGVAFTRHGGRRIDFQIRGQASSDFYGLAWSAGVWSTLPPAPVPDSLLSGTTWSFLRRTHEGDSLVRTSGPSTFGGTAGATAAVFDVNLGTSSQTGRLLAQVSRPLVAPTVVSGRRNAQVDSAGNFIQYVESTAPADQIVSSNYQTGAVKVLPSPFGDRVLVVFNYLDFTVSAPTGWIPGGSATPIGSNWSYQVRSPQIDNGVSAKAEVLSIPWAGGTALPLWDRPARTIGWIGLSESPSPGLHEAVLGIGQVDQAAAQPFIGGYTTCNVEYVNALTGGSIRSRTAPPITCGQGQIEFGTLAPVRAAADKRGRN